MPSPFAVGRMLLLPVVLGVQLVPVLASPLLFFVAAAICQRSSRPARTVALVVRFALIELKTVGLLVRGASDIDELVSQVAQDSYDAMRSTLAVPVVVEPRVLNRR